MLTFADALRHQYLYKLNEVSFDISIGLNEWLQNGKEYLITKDNLSNDFTIDTYEYTDFLNPYAADVNRLSCAALESLNDIDQHPKSPKSLAWILTKYYYSAFFSAHCILRITGNCIANIQEKSLVKVKKITSDYGFTSANLNKGQYCIAVDHNNKSFRFFKNSIYENSHEGLWRRFLDYLNAIGPGIIGNLPVNDAAQILDQIDSLKSALTNWGSNGGNWLSRIRNQVNYNQDYGVWFPYNDYSKKFDAIFHYQSLSKENAIKIDLNEVKDRELLYFVKSCQLINSINFDLLVDLSSRHPSNRSFVLNGIIKYHNVFLNKNKYNLGLINL